MNKNVLSFAAGMLAAFALGVLMAATPVTAQQATRTKWQVGRLFYTDVGVIDTSGVCIYVSEGYKSGGIAVVPKSQLPVGAGCQ